MAFPRIVVGVLLGVMVAMPPAVRADFFACEEWVKGTTAGPPARAGHAMVWDSARNRVILFGGFGLVGGDVAPYDDTWEYDPAANVWQEIATTGRPYARGGHGMAYDQARARVVLFGGQTDADGDDHVDFGNDTWEYDPATATWTARFVPVSQRPAPVGGVTLAYDPVRNVTVLFGGHDEEFGFNGVVEWNGSTWTARPTAHRPDVRTGHAMTYDAALGGVVVFGGFAVTDSSFEELFGDAWVYDGSDWHQFPDIYPVGRSGHAMVSDSGHGQLIVFGGFETDAGSTWIRNPAGPWKDGQRFGPPAVGASAMVYDPVGGRSILFGGTGGGSFTADTWTLDGVPPRLAPIGPASDSLVTPCATTFFGTQTLDPDAGPYFYLWRRYLKGEWKPLLDHGRISGAHTAALKIDPLRAADVGTYDVQVSNICGATISESYRIRLADGHWEPGPFLPEPRHGFAMAYDTDRERMVIHGGETAGLGLPIGYGNGTFESAAGGTWTSAADPGPSPRGLHAMAYDAERHRMVLYGGFYSDPPNFNDPTPPFSIVYGDTWEYDGTTWTQRSPLQSPDPRASHGLTWDPVRKRIVLFGGITSGRGVATPAMWEYDGTTWSLRPGTGDPTIGPSGASLGFPPGRTEMGLAFDTKRGALVVHGGSTYLANGNDPNFKRGDLWEQIGLQWSRRGFFTDYARSLGEHRAMAYDAKHDATLLFTYSESPLGDELGILWGWNPATADWEEKPNRLPIYRGKAAMAYDAKRERVVLAGGYRGCYSVGGGPKICDLADTWEWEFFDFDPKCGIETCGDGFKDVDEECDEAYFCCTGGCHLAPAGFSCAEYCPQGTCNADGSCSCPSLCGNGVVDADEACDPGTGDACCDSTCQIHVGSLCDGGPACQSATCQPDGSCFCNQSCGNGVIETGVSGFNREECDPPGECCSPKCKVEPLFSVCGNACRGDRCTGATTACAVGPLDPTGCTPASSAKGFIDTASGGIATTPDARATLFVPPGVATFEATYGIAGGLTTSSFGVGTPESRVFTARLLPEGTIFGYPGASLIFRWRDDDMNDIVDGTSVYAGNLRIYKDGVQIAGPCATMRYCPVTAEDCCNLATHEMRVQLSSFSELVLVEGSPCAAPTAAKLSLTKMLPPAGDDGLAFTATLPAPSTPPDPDTAGLGIVVNDADGTVLDTTLPPGGYDKKNKIGWKVDKRRTKWSWSYPKGDAPGGIVKVSLALNAKKGVLKVLVKGAGGAYAATAPATLALRFPGNDGCARATFAESGHACTLKGKGKTLVCK